MKKILPLLATLFLLCGCAVVGAELLEQYLLSGPSGQMSLSEQKQCIRNRQFVADLSPKAFSEEWGKPDKQGAWIYNSEKRRCEVTEWNDTLEQGKILKIVWVYENKPDDGGRILFFYENNLRSSFEWKAYQERERTETFTK